MNTKHLLPPNEDEAAASRAAAPNPERRHGLGHVAGAGHFETTDFWRSNFLSRPANLGRPARVKSKALATIAAALLLATVPARAINLVLVYDDLGENPAWDPNGTALMAIAQAAALRWERLIPSAGTHTVDVSWSHLDITPTGAQLGLWKFDPSGNNNLYFNSDINWFVDPTPNSDTEFSFGDPLDFASFGSQIATTNPNSQWFTGATPPKMLEVGRFGDGMSGEADTNSDLLSVILHEMGHEIGVAGDEFSGTYAIYSSHVLGITGLEAREISLEGSSGFGEEHGHLGPVNALMSPNLPPGMRVLPSALDVLVAARDSNYTSVDLLRKFTGRSGDWGDATDWIGGRVPDADDVVIIAHGGTTTLTGARTADSVNLGASTLLDATGDLVVDREMRLGSGGSLRLNNLGAELTAQTLDAQAGSTIELVSGRLTVAGGTLASGGTLFGRGTVTANGTLSIGGLMDAVGDLRIEGTGALHLLDPSSDASTVVMRARLGNLGLAIGFTSTSRGVIEVTGGHNLTALADVVIPADVRVQLHDSSGGTAIINSLGTDTDLTIHNLWVGELLSYAEGTAQIQSRTVTLEDDADVHGTLTFASSVLTTLRGGLHLKGFNGHLVQAGDISVQGGEVRLFLYEFDWGNSTSVKTNTITIGPSATLNVWPDTLGSASNQFRGNLQIDSGVLYVQSVAGWELPAPSGTTPGGTLSMIHNGTADPMVVGVPFTARDLLLVAGGNAFIKANLTIAPTASVAVFGNAALFLEGTTTLNGGSYTGLGSLVQRGDIDVIGNTTIATEVFDWGNSLGSEFHTLTVRSGATLTVNSPGTGNPDNQFRGLVRLEGGKLVVNTDTGWILPASSFLTIPGTLELDNGGTAPRVSGQPITIGKRLAVTGGAAHIDVETLFLTTAETDLAIGATLHMNGSTTYRGTFTGAGTLQHNGSALVTSTPLSVPHFVQAGLITVITSGGEGKLLTQTLAFSASSETRVFSDLRIAGAASVAAGALFNGGKTLIVDAAGTLSGGGVIGVNVRNEGTVAPGSSAGLLSMGGNYTQTGTLAVEIGGTPLNSFDRLSITGAATLSGGLNISLIGGFVPKQGQTFQILTAGGLSGGFTAFSQPAGMPAGLAFSISYTASAVTLTVVPVTPYESWINSFGSITDPAQRTRNANPDNDGLNNLGEFALDGNPASGLATGKVVVKIARVGDTEALTLTLPVRIGAKADPADPAGGELVLRQTDDAVTYTIQASETLTKWTLDVTEVTNGDAANIQTGLPALSAGWVYRTFRSPGAIGSVPAEFMRIVIGE